MARRSTKHANRLLDRMFAAAARKDFDDFDAADHDLLSEYSDEADWDETLDAMPRPILVRYLGAATLYKRQLLGEGKT